MRIAVLLLLNLLAQQVLANDVLWQKLKTEADLVVLMRHTRPAGSNPLTWDESGGCKGESREIATADRERTGTFERKAQSLIASHRGSPPVVFVSHRPNIDLLSLELIGEGELLVARANEHGELTVLGKIQVQP